MHRLLQKAALSLLLGVTVTGCSTLPGMQIDRGNAVRTEGVVEAADVRFELIPITPNLVTELERRPRASAAAQEDTPRSLGEAEAYEYRVQPRDVLSVIVWEHPELTIPTGEFRSAEEAGRLVREDGTIFYPYAGVINVAGMTVEEIRRLIVDRLEPLIQNPQVDVRVASFRSQRVYVTGQVVQPGLLPVTDVPLSVLDAINTAGGFNEEADRATAFLTRGNERYRVDLNALYDGGDISENYLLRHGDVLHVPDNIDNKVFVLGEVGQQSPVFLHRGALSLAEAIAQAEGIDMDRADTAGVYVVRGDAGPEGFQPKVFQLDARSPTAMVLADAFPLQARDVVFVSTAPLSRWNRVVSQILPSIQAVWQTRAITR